MSEHHHLTAAALRDLLTTPASGAALVAAATCLAEQCPACWAVLLEAAPPDLAGRPSVVPPSPIQAALIRFITPET